MNRANLRAAADPTRFCCDGRCYHTTAGGCPGRGCRLDETELSLAIGPDDKRVIHAPRPPPLPPPVRTESDNAYRANAWRLFIAVDLAAIAATAVLLYCFKH